MKKLIVLIALVSFASSASADKRANLQIPATYAVDSATRNSIVSTPAGKTAAVLTALTAAEVVGIVISSAIAYTRASSCHDGRNSPCGEQAMRAANASDALIGVAVGTGTGALIAWIVAAKQTRNRGDLVAQKGTP